MSDIAKRLLSLLRSVRRMLPRFGGFLLCYIDLQRVQRVTPKALRDEKEIAVLRLDNIGDFILGLDAARAIRARYPKGEYRITLLTDHVWAALAEASGLCDAVIPVERKRYFFDPPYRKDLLKRLAQGRYAQVIVMMYSRSTRIDDILAKATGATHRIAHEGDLSNSDFCSKWITDRWYDVKIRVGDRAPHELDKNLALARHFDPQAALRPPRLEPSMIRYPVDLPAGQDYFVLAPGATSAIRKWPVERFAQIAQAVHARTGWTCIICGAAGDGKDAEGIMAAAPGLPFMNLCGRTSLPELAGTLARAKLAVTNETGSAHMSAAVGAPTCMILGGGHFGRFAPYPDAIAGASGGRVKTAYHGMTCYRCNWQCVYRRKPEEPGPCVAAVTVDHVWRLIEPLLPLQGAIARQL